MWNVYLPLIGYKHVSGSESATLVPYLATALPHISADGRTYSLRLRRGLRYSNGEPVLASDFKRTIERDVVLDSAGAALFANIAGVDALREDPEARDQRDPHQRSQADDRHPSRRSRGRLRERPRL